MKIPQGTLVATNGHCAYCKKPFIPDLQGFAPQAIKGLGDDDIFIIHQHCLEDMNAELGQKRTERAKQKLMLDFFKKMSMVFIIALIGATILSFGVAYALSDVLPAKEWVKGAVIIGTTNEGCVWKPFVKTGFTDPDEDGNAQILGYSPGSVQTDKQGRIIWERVLEDRFVRLGMARSFHGHWCKAPPFFE